MINWDTYPDLGGADGRVVLNDEALYQLRVRYTLLRGEIQFVGGVFTRAGNLIAESPPLLTMEAAQRAAEALLIDVLINALGEAMGSVAGTMSCANAAALWRRLDTASNEFERRVLCTAPDYPDEEA